MRPDPPLIFGSADQIAAEATALAVLKDVRQSLPFFPRFVEQVVLFQNPAVRGLDQADVRRHPYIRHGMKIGLGRMPEELVFDHVPGRVQERLHGLLQ